MTMKRNPTPKTPAMVHLTETTGGPTLADVLSGLPEDTITAFDGEPGSGVATETIREEITRLLAEKGHDIVDFDEDPNGLRGLGDEFLVQERYRQAGAWLPAGYSVCLAESEEEGWLLITHDTGEDGGMFLYREGEWLTVPVFAAAFSKTLTSLRQKVEA
ncbi:hypothetical protein [Sanguibacter sp. Leaf3]|uniref:hypothetical protein n=1 Tax=Sanguibacter sp. Leaf3 TaxID=1736209 RepID=UPI0012E3DBCA|nr:hypothetical protein [Sanguibacter sp. Leaf3]